MRDAALRALDDLDAFFAPLDPPPGIREALAFQRAKLATPGARYAERVLAGADASLAAAAGLSAPATAPSTEGARHV